MRERVWCVCPVHAQCLQARQPALPRGSDDGLRVLASKGSHSRLGELRKEVIGQDHASPFHRQLAEAGEHRDREVEGVRLEREVDA
jgi:hypothetical protein